MPLERLSAKVAMKSSRENPFDRWPKRDGGPDRVEPICKPAFHPGFKLNPGDKIFTIGSCFARNVERALADRGFEILVWRVLRADPEFEALGPYILNNYAAPSIFNEISWALDPARPFEPDKNFHEVFPGKFVDLHLTRGVRPASLETVKTRRAAITRIYREASECPLTIMTLGLAEAWYDCETSLYLNTRPHQSMMLSFPERYELHVLDYSDTIGFLGKTFDLLAANRRADSRVLLTVSPVPLTSTYRGIDVITANTYSKSVLRAAAEEIASRYDFVEYFPSYESVTLSRRDLTWTDDQVHVRQEIIDINVGRMIAAYTGMTVDIATFEADESARPAETAASSSDQEQAVHTSESEIQRARLLLEKKQATEAAEILRRLASEPPSGARADYKPRLNAIWSLLLEATIATEPAEAAAKVLEDWKAAVRSIRKAQPYHQVALAFIAAGNPAAAESYFREGLDCPNGANGRILADYIKFLVKQGRSAEAARHLPMLDLSRESPLKRIYLRWLCADWWNPKSLWRFRAATNK